MRHHSFCRIAFAGPLVFVVFALAAASKTAYADEPSASLAPESATDPVQSEPAPTIPAATPPQRTTTPPRTATPAPPPSPYPYTPASPDDAYSDNTVLGSRLAHGGYGAPELKLTTLAGDPVMFAGAQGGWIVGHRVVIGGGGYGSVSHVVSPSSLQPPTGDALLSMSYGGFRIGAVAAPRKIVHMTFGVLIGGGSASSETRTGTFERTERFFVVEPDLAAEVNLARYIRFTIGGTFRFAGGTDAPGFTASRLSGPGATMAIKFGEF